MKDLDDLVSELVDTGYCIKERLKDLNPEQTKRASEQIHFTNFQYGETDQYLVIGTPDPGNLHFYLGLHVNPTEFVIDVRDYGDMYTVFGFDSSGDTGLRLYKVLYGDQ